MKSGIEKRSKEGQKKCSLMKLRGTYDYFACFFLSDCACTRVE